MLPAFIHRVFMLAAAAAMLLALAANGIAGDEPPRHPVPASPVRALPSLARSDAAVRESLLKVPGAEALAPLLDSGDVLRRFVAGVDDVAGGNVEPHAGAIAALEKLEPRAAVTLYARFYPLLQQAYQQTSTRGGYFNDRFVQAIDALLQREEESAREADAKLREVRKRLALRPPGG